MNVMNLTANGKVNKGRNTKTGGGGKMMKKNVANQTLDEEKKDIDLEDDMESDESFDCTSSQKLLQNLDFDTEFDGSKNFVVGQSKKRKYAEADEEKEDEEESKSIHLKDKKNSSNRINSKSEIWRGETKLTVGRSQYSPLQLHHKQQDEEERRQRQKRQHTKPNVQSEFNPAMVSFDPFMMNWFSNPSALPIPPSSDMNSFPTNTDPFHANLYLPSQNFNNVNYSGFFPINPLNVNNDNVHEDEIPTADSVKTILMKNESPQQQLQEARLRTLTPQERKIYREERAHNRRLAEEENNVELKKGNKQKWFICYESPDCDYKTKYKHCLKRHSNELHAELVTWYQCDEPGCDYKTKQKSNVQRHKSNIHHVNANTIYYKCDYDGECTFTTKYKSDLPRHKREVHEAIYRFECGVTPHCTFQTKLKKGLKSHSVHCHDGAEEDPSIKWYYCEKKVPLSLSSQHSANAGANEISTEITEKCTFKTKFPHFLQQHVEEYHQKPKGKATSNINMDKSMGINISDSNKNPTSFSDVSTSMTQQAAMSSMSNRSNSLGGSLTLTNSLSLHSNSNIIKGSFDGAVDSISKTYDMSNNRYSRDTNNSTSNENIYKGGELNENKKIIHPPYPLLRSNSNMEQSKFSTNTSHSVSFFMNNSPPHHVDKSGFSAPVSPINNRGGRVKGAFSPQSHFTNFNIDSSTSNYNGLNTSQLGTSVSRSGINIMQKSNLSNDLNTSISGSNGSSNSARSNSPHLNYVGGTLGTGGIGMSSSGYSMTNSQSVTPFMPDSPSRAFSPVSPSSSSHGSHQWQSFQSRAPVVSAGINNVMNLKLESTYLAKPPMSNGNTMNFHQANENVSTMNSSSIGSSPKKTSPIANKSSTGNNTTPNNISPNNHQLSPTSPVPPNYSKQYKSNPLSFPQVLSPLSMSGPGAAMSDNMPIGGIGLNFRNPLVDSSHVGGKINNPLSPTGTNTNKHRNMNINPTIADKISALSKLTATQQSGNDLVKNVDFGKKKEDNQGQITHLYGNEVTSIVTKVPDDNQNNNSNSAEALSKKGGVLWYHCDVSPQCNYKTVRKGDLKNHKKRVHLIGENITIYHCDVNQELCQFTTPYKQALTTHKANIHDIGTNIRWYVCAEEQSIAPHCEYKSKRKGDLQKHQKLIHGIEPPEKKRGRSAI